MAKHLTGNNLLLEPMATLSTDACTKHAKDSASMNSWKTVYDCPPGAAFITMD